jgi:hypothetical protein
MRRIEPVAPVTGEPLLDHWYVGELVATATRATVPPVTVAEIGCVVKAGAFAEVGVGVGVGVGVTVEVTMTSKVKTLVVRFGGPVVVAGFSTAWSIMT